MSQFYFDDPNENFISSDEFELGEATAPPIIRSTVNPYEGAPTRKPTGKGLSIPRINPRNYDIGEAPRPNNQEFYSYNSNGDYIACLNGKNKPPCRVVIPANAGNKSENQTPPNNDGRKEPSKSLADWFNENQSTTIYLAFGLIAVLLITKKGK
jgi:hypothetical protein